jgi:hypothetical protein
MNQESFIRPAFSILFVISISLILESCSTIGWLVNEGKEQQTSLRHESYMINSVTILESLKQGKEGVFTPQKTSSDAIPTPSIVRIQWKQSDFLFIAQSFFKFAWQESITDWSLRTMEFNLKCFDVTSGPQAAKFVFFKENQTKDGNSRISRTVYILADENRIMMSETEYFPEVDRWLAIDPSKDLTVEGALSIFEKNAGANFRQDTNNSCVIEAENNANGDHDIWLITYSGISNEQGKSLSLNLNARTGEFNKIH